MVSQQNMGTELVSMRKKLALVNSNSFMGAGSPSIVYRTSYETIVLFLLLRNFMLFTRIQILT